MIVFVGFIVWISTVYACFYFLGRDIGAWVAIAISGVLWFVLKQLSDRQEQLLYEDVENLTEEEYEGFLDDLEKEGLLERDVTKEKEQ